MEVLEHHIPPPVAQPQAPKQLTFAGQQQKMPARGAAHPKANSTSTVFTASSLCDPDTDDLIMSVSMVLQLHMIQDQHADQEKKDAFYFFNEYNDDDEKMGVDSEPRRNVKRMKMAPPPLEYVYKFIKAIFECAQFSAECNIISLIFINRLIAFTGMPLHSVNWRPVLLTALLVAQKVWDDRSLVNAHFSIICPLFTTSRLNQFERCFLELLDYDVSVSSRLYAKYYFELRTLCEEQVFRAFPLAPLTSKAARRLENRSASVARVYCQSREPDHRPKTQDHGSGVKGRAIILS